MAEKSLFFNAMQDNTSATGYDRNYNADDISDWFSIVCENGVVKTNIESGEPKGLKVVAAGGMTFNVNVGKATIKGKGYINDSLKTFTCEVAGSSVRYDYVVLRYNNVQTAADTSRKISIEYVKGTGNVPTVANLTRTNEIYELMLAYITIPASGSSLGTIYDMRGNNEVCGWFTAVKGYEDYYDAIILPYEYNGTMESLGTTFITNLSSNLYNAKYSIIDVYTNGIKEPKTAYSVSVIGDYIVINFNASKTAGTKITVNLDNFLDGEGLNNVLTQYTQWVQTVADLKTAGEYNYICNGASDNVNISRIAQAFANDTTLPSNAQLTINVYGNLGISVAYGGFGNAFDAFRWFDIGTPSGSNKRIIVDFTHCGVINVPLSGNTTNIIFSGYNVHVKNARLIANCSADGCVNYIFSSTSGEIKAENCYIESVVTNDVCLSYSGTFINCEAYLSSKTRPSYCFYLGTNYKPVVVIGGRYRAYTGSTSTSIVSAVVYSPSAETGATCVLYGVNCPTLAQTNFTQRYAVYVNGGYISSLGLITALPITTGTGVTSAMVGTIPLSK